MLHHQLLVMAFAQADPGGAAKQIEWFAGKPEEYLSLMDQAAEARARRQLRRARALLRTPRTWRDSGTFPTLPTGS